MTTVTLSYTTSGDTTFSEDWLGMEGSYFRGKRTAMRAHSPKALATCAARLMQRAQTLQSSSMPQVRERAIRYSELADSCVHELLASATAEGETI